MECEIDGIYDSLVKDGQPDEEEITAAWIGIKAQYADAIANREYVSYRTLYKDIGVMRLTMFQIETLVHAMRKVYAPELSDRLNAVLKTKFDFDPEDAEKYNSLLDACITRSKSIKIQLDIKEMQFSAMAEGEAEGEKITRDHFLSTLIGLSDFAKYQLNDSITVFEFCDRIRRFNKHCEQEKQKKNVGRVNR